MDQITKGQMTEQRLCTERKGSTEEFYAVLCRGWMSRLHFRIHILVTTRDEAGGDPRGRERH